MPMLSENTIKKAMAARGYRNTKTEDQFSVRGKYARNLQMVYRKEHRFRSGRIVDLIYVAVDIQSEKLVISLYRENPDIEKGVLEDCSRSIPLSRFSREALQNELELLITDVIPVPDPL